MQQGAALILLSTKIRETLSCCDEPALVSALASRWDRLEQVTALLHQTGDLDLTLANATVYLEAFGHLVMAWIWMEQSIVARRASNEDTDFYAGKLQACQWFFRWELPRVDAQLDLLSALDNTALRMQDNWF